MNILVVEDERRVADFIQRGLSCEGYTVVLAHDGETALRFLANDNFDAVVLDLMLPNISGQDVCRRMRVRQDTTPVLMLSALDQVDDRVAGLQLGADDYLIKPFAFDELVARIQALLRRSKDYLVDDAERHILTVGGIRYNTESLEVTCHEQAIALTDKERRILQLLLTDPDRVHSRERILNVVWGTAADPLTNIIDVYIARLRRKLGEAGQSIETIRGVGYRLSSDRP
ncbi:MAG: response regulator transcription factor [Gammaproteobacteria bacterium]